MIRTALRLPSARIALALLAVVAFISIFGAVIAPQNPLAQDYDAILQGPSAAHWLGTDDVGRDVLSRFLAGSGISVLAALEAVGVGLVAGTLPGILSVTLGRRFEWVSLRIVDSLMTLPFLVFAIALAALLGNGLVQAMFAVGILLMPTFYRISRAASLSVAHSRYIEAAELLGASTTWIVRKHVLKKVVPAIAVTTASTIGASLVIVSSLTFLGIGVVPPTPTWGGLLADSLENLYQQPWGPVAPGLVIVLTVWALNALADALRDASGASARQTVGARVSGLFTRRRPVTTGGSAGFGAPTSAGVPTSSRSGEVPDAV